MAQNATLYIGLMSGTSMDGVDAVLAEFESKPRVVAHHQLAYSTELLSELRHAASGSALPAQEWLKLDHQLGELFAKAALAVLETADLSPERVTAIGHHGQTVWHQPSGKHPNTWQIGNANIVAARTGITTVADFRGMDMALGGQGAPLVPAFHAAVFGHTKQRRAILNLGGIANITLLNAGEGISGYDTGPANCLLDTHYRHRFDQPYDSNGDWAAQGQINKELLAAMLGDAYFSLAAPKSTGPEHFSWGWVRHFLKQQPCEGANLQATLTELTARTVAQEILAQKVDQVIACGGGVYNQHLMQRLQTALPNCRIESSAAHGLDPQHIEALAFAWLAKQRLERKPGNMPSVTGASRDCLLGAIYSP